MELLLVTLVGLGVLGAIVMLMILLYAASLGSRKSYCCPKCGEQIKTEYLDAQHCGMCGTPLNQNGGIQ